MCCSETSCMGVFRKDGIYCLVGQNDLMTPVIVLPLFLPMQHFLRRADCEQLIRQGVLEQISWSKHSVQDTHLIALCVSCTALSPLPVFCLSAQWPLLVMSMADPGIVRVQVAEWPILALCVCRLPVAGGPLCCPSSFINCRNLALNCLLR